MVADHIKESRPAPEAARGPVAERTITSKELFGGAQRVWIEHAGERYRLQLTRSGRLILTK